MIKHIMTIALLLSISIVSAQKYQSKSKKNVQYEFTDATYTIITENGQYMSLQFS